MAGWTGLSARARGAALLGGAAVVAVVGYFGVLRGPDAEAPGTDQGAEVAAAPAEPTAVQTEVAATAVTPAAEATAAAETAVILPSFDVARIAPDGAATVAGVAAPGAAVAMLVDGVEVAKAQADGQGKFAALFDLPPSPVPRMLTLQAVGADGVAVIGVETVAVAPVVAAQVVTTEAAVPAVQAPVAVLVAPEGVKVLQSGADVTAELVWNVAVNTISYAPDGAVMLGGRAEAGAGLRIYLDGLAIADVAVGPDGAWAATLRDVAAGIYTLRVDQLGADGKVTSRFETPFKRETLEALAAAAAPVPEASAEVVAPSAAAPVAEPAPVAAAAPETAPAAAAAVPAEVAVAKPADATPVAPAKPAPVSVTVQPGYTLWGIAQQNFGDGVLYVQVFEANKDKIKNPDLIYPGQVFTIPAAP